MLPSYLYARDQFVIKSIDASSRLIVIIATWALFFLVELSDRVGAHFWDNVPASRATEYSFFDGSNGLSRVEIFWAGIGAVHDGMTAVKSKWVV